MRLVSCHKEQIGSYPGKGRVAVAQFVNSDTAYGLELYWCMEQQGFC